MRLKSGPSNQGILGLATEVGQLDAPRRCLSFLVAPLDLGLLQASQ